MVLRPLERGRGGVRSVRWASAGRLLIGWSVVAAVFVGCGDDDADRAVEEFSTICTEVGVELAAVSPSPDSPVQESAPELILVLEPAIERLRAVDAPDDVSEVFDQAIQKLVAATNVLDVVARSTTVDAAVVQFQTAAELAAEAFALVEPLGVECNSSP